MKKNLNSADRIIRILVAVIFAILILTNQVNDIAALILGVFAFVFAATSFVSFCPIYWLTGLSTRKNTNQHA